MRERVEEIVRTISELCDETRIAEKIDRQIDVVVQAFDYERDSPVSREYFHLTLARFV